MQPPQAHPVYQFGDFELDSLKRTLVSRTTGQPVDITGRVAEALVYLVERAGQLVEKKALMDALWPHVVVEDGNLTQTIHTLRRALGEKAGEHRYIATVPGRGYRFVAEVRLRGSEALVEATPAPRPAPELQTAPVPQPVPATQPTPVPQSASTPKPEPTPRAARAWVVGAIAAAVLAGAIAAAMLMGRDDAKPVATSSPPKVAAPPSIAVLPFVDMSEARDQQHFAEGLSEEILNLLTRADTLRVIARTSSFSFRDENADIRTIAQRLSVSHVLEGSVRKSGERVRITAQLIDATTSVHVWSDTFDRKLDDIFGVQREIATAVADALHTKLRANAPSRAETRSTRAYEHYLQGRHLFHRRSGSDLIQARAHFEQAVQIDPEYGRAWTALAGVYFVSGYEEVELPNRKEKWRIAVERAIALSPDVAEAHVRAAQYFWHSGDNVRALAEIARARAVDPQDPLLVAMAVSDAVLVGNYDEAVERQRKMVAIDPLSAINRGNLGGLLMMAGRYREAQAEIERALELSPASRNSLSSIADVLILQGRTDEALRVVTRMREGYLRDARLAVIHFSRGDVRECEAMLAQLQQRARERSSDVDVAVAIADVYAAKGDADRAFFWLDDAYRRAEELRTSRLVRWGLHESLLLDPHLKSLHADPRWAQLRRDTKLPQESQGS